MIHPVFGARHRKHGMDHFFNVFCHFFMFFTFFSSFFRFGIQDFFRTNTFFSAKNVDRITKQKIKTVQEVILNLSSIERRTSGYLKMRFFTFAVLSLCFAVSYSDFNQDPNFRCVQSNDTLCYSIDLKDRVLKCVKLDNSMIRCHSRSTQCIRIKVNGKCKYILF